MPCTRTGIPPRSISAGDGPVIAERSRPHGGAVDKHPVVMRCFADQADSKRKSLRLFRLARLIRRPVSNQFHR